MPGTFRLRAPFTALLTMRLAEGGHEVVGLTVHVPQYLHEMSYPDAAIALLSAVVEERGPRIGSEALEAQAGPVREAVAAQVDAQPALQEMVAGLEQRYDRMITSGAGSVVPTADAIAAEVEEYLASFGEDEGHRPEDGSGTAQGHADSHGPDAGSGPDAGEGPDAGTGADGRSPGTPAS